MGSIVISLWTSMQRIAAWISGRHVERLVNEPGNPPRIPSRSVHLQRPVQPPSTDEIHFRNDKNHKMH